MNRRPSVDARFWPMPAGRGSRLVVCHHPAGTPRATVVYVHPFAEEKNKARRMAALQARALAAVGFMVVLLDLEGCGDSSGELVDTTWPAWVTDVVEVSRRALEDGAGPLVLWGLRAGCLVAVEAVHQLDEAAALIFWQPTPQGKTVLQQFLRLKMAAELNVPGAKGVVEAARSQLGRGESVDVAGYALPARLALGLDAARLDPPGTRPLPVAWIEVASHAEASLLPASEPVVAAWRNAGHSVQTSVVQGPTFWNSVEIEEAPALVTATLAAVESLVRP